jgi:signal transduction histidine kinase/ligand-binding sensor domain-containing protein
MQMLKYILISASLFFCTAFVAAQLTEPGEQYPFVHYTPKDGLVNSRVRKAYQDSKGRMYFITYGGLSVYNGARFKNYTTQNGLLANLVNDVVEVGDDSLLVAVNTCGINVLVHGQMKTLEVAKNFCPLVNHFLKSADGNIYATTDDGLYKLSSGSFKKLPAVIPVQNIPAAFLGDIAEYKDYLVLTTNDLRNYLGLFLYNKKTGVITDVLPEIPVYSLKTDNTGTIWLSNNKTIAILDTLALLKGKLELIKPGNSFVNQGLLVTGSINFNKENELMILSSSKGITIYRKDKTLQHIVLPEFSTTVVQNSFFDRENVLWICHDGNGVYKLSNTKLQSVPSLFKENKSGVRIVKPVSADSCWMVMNNRQWLLQTSLKTTKFNISPSFDANAIFSSNNVLYAADFHNLYISTQAKKNETTLHFKKIFTLPDNASFGGHSVTDPYGNMILFGSRNICVIQNGKKIAEYPLPAYDLIEGMYMDRNNRLWITSRNSGLIIFSLHPDNPVHYIKKEYEFINEFEKASARCMAVDGNELLWVGTRYHGLMGFEFKNNRLIKRYHFQTHNGLTDNFITALACDKNNNVIVGTQTGLDRLIKTKDGFRPENVTKSNNIFSYINFIWVDKNDNAFAWTNAGTVFKAAPVQEEKNTTTPQLLIEEIKVNGQPLAGHKLPMHLKYDQRNITFSVAAPAFFDEKQIKYSYLLSGNGNKEWSDTTSIADITLLNLSPASYTLHIKAFFLSTAYAPKEIIFSFVIQPPWWQTWWFRTMIGMLVIGILFTAIRFYYHRKLEKQKIALEKQQAIEKERSRIASDIHDDLGAGLSTIRFLSEKVKRNSFSDTTKLDAEKIVNNSNELVQKMNELIWAMNEKNDTLEDLLFYARSYAAEYGEENNLQMDIIMPEKIPEIMVAGEMRRNVFLTLKESLHNIVKHAEAKRVIIKFFTDKNLSVIIMDDGKGFEKINEEGNGLKNMKKRIDSIGGFFEITNTNGVTVSISVPLQ